MPVPDERELRACRSGGKAGPCDERGGRSLRLCAALEDREQRDSDQRHQRRGSPVDAPPPPRAPPSRESVSRPRRISPPSSTSTPTPCSARLRLLRDEGLLEFRRGHGISVAGTPERGAVVQRAKELVQFARCQGLPPRRAGRNHRGRRLTTTLGAPTSAEPTAMLIARRPSLRITRIVRRQIRSPAAAL